MVARGCFRQGDYLPRLIRIALILIIGALAARPLGPRFIGSAALPPVVQTHGHLTILRLRGTPYEMGYQRGIAQREVIRQWVSEKAYDRTILGAAQPHGLLLAHARHLENTLPPEIRSEMRGIADGAGLSFQDVLLLNLVLNRLTASLPLINPLPAPPTLELQALAVAAWPPAAAQDDLFVGYLLETLYPAEWLRKHLLVVIYQPAHGSSYSTLTWSGQVGAWCGLNEAGLAICATPAETRVNGAEELSPALLTRQLLAQAANREQALRQAIQRDYTAAFQLLIADAASRSATVIAYSDHKYEITSDAESRPGLLLIGPNSGQLAPALNHNHESLDRDKTLDILNSRGVCGENTLFNVLFDPARGELWVGLDLWPASCRRYLQIK